MRVELTTPDGRRRGINLRSLTGADEMALDPGAPLAVTRLLERLWIDEGRNSGSSTEAFRALSVTERDQLIAAVYRSEYGEQVEGMATCEGCHEPFEFSFALAGLLDTLGPSAVRAATAEQDGYYRLRNGTRFRIPTVSDLEACAGLGIDSAADALLTRCLAEPASARSSRAVENALQQLAPVLSLDMSLSCPHCGLSQTAPFSLEEHLLHSLGQERPLLTLEIHRLATAYGWPLTEILALTRADRRTFVRRIEAERIGGGAA